MVALKRALEQPFSVDLISIKAETKPALINYKSMTLSVPERHLGLCILKIYIHIIICGLISHPLGSNMF